LGSKGFRLDFGHRKVYFFLAQHKISDPWIDHTTYKNFMTNKFRFWAPKDFDWTLDQHKILHQIKPKNIKIGQYFTWK
jgi:hypothetical protein